MDITIAHSPDSDDAFMFYALTCGRIPTEPYQIRHVLRDIESLNQAARNSTFEVSAISLHAYPFVAQHYALLPCGASVGDDYGPLVVSQSGWTLAQFVSQFSAPGSALQIGIPGEWTTAFLVLKLLVPSFRYKVIPFDRIEEACVRGEVDAGLLIHEGQLTFRNSGLKKIVDLGQWWKQETKLPLPLGANVIRRDLGEKHIEALTKLIRKSIEFGLAEENRKDAIAYCMQFARNLDPIQTERFVRMYVNRRTVDFDPETIEAINLLYAKAAARGILPKQNPIQYGRF